MRSRPPAPRQQVPLPSALTITLRTAGVLGFIRTVRVCVLFLGRLLLLGLQRFGTDDWAALQRYYLVDKSPKQIAVRVKNLSSSRATETAVKVSHPCSPRAAGSR